MAYLVLNVNIQWTVTFDPSHYRCCEQRWAGEIMKQILSTESYVRRDAELQSRLQRWRLAVRRPDQKAPSTSRHITRRKLPETGRQCLPVEGGRAERRKKDIYDFNVLIEDVLLTLANQIERKRRGSGLHWIFETPLPFRRLGRVGKTHRGGHHSRIIWQRKGGKNSYRSCSPGTEMQGVERDTQRETSSADNA
ncbi:hypothetical protein Q8A73_007064 [Channa argus]|nr:hypothetical protein Q8A73_007064 [Channa argus]